MKRLQLILGVTALAIALAACGNGAGQPAQPAPQQETNGLTQAQLEHGIGPIQAFELEPINQDLAARGQELYTVKCSACHKMDQRYVGPALADITETRSPAYIMNMILNPEEMVQKHPEAKKLFAQFMTPMANQNLTEEEARAVLEYLRTQAPN